LFLLSSVSLLLLLFALRMIFSHPQLSFSSLLAAASADAAACVLALLLFL
jgi:hypothetical protein